MSAAFTRKNIPAIGQGTWHMDEARDRAEAIRALRRGIDLGLTHIDTAEMYGDGEAELMVNEAIAGHRNKVFLVSKVLPSNASRRGTIRACEQSLKRLGTDHLDSYLLHWRGAYPLDETFEAFDDLLQSGLIRSWGVSNFDDSDIEEAVGIAGPRRIACNQVLYNVTQRHVEATVLPLCRNDAIPIVAYSPLASGSFPHPNTQGGRVLAEIGAQHGASARAVALAFVVRFDDVFAIPKASTVAHVEDNARALGLRLQPDEVEAIDAAFPVRVEARLPVL